MDGICKDCKHWIDIKSWILAFGICDRIEKYVDSDDDIYFRYDFGCNFWEAKDEDEM